jgi:hypothetical protein
MRPQTPAEALYTALIHSGKDVDIRSHLTAGERNACILAVERGAGHLRAPGLGRKWFTFKRGWSEYGVPPPRGWRYCDWPHEPAWVHYTAGEAEGRRLARDHYTHDGRFEQQTRTRYTAADECDEPRAARDAYWYGVQRGYYE